MSDFRRRRDCIKSYLKGTQRRQITELRHIFNAKSAQQDCIVAVVVINVTLANWLQNCVNVSCKSLQLMRMQFCRLIKWQVASNIASPTSRSIAEICRCYSCSQRQPLPYKLQYGHLCCNQCRFALTIGCVGFDRWRNISNNNICL